VAIGVAWGVLDLYEESLRKRKTTVLPLIPMTEHGQYPRFYGEALQMIDVAECALLQSDHDYMEWSRRAAAGEIEFDMELDRRLQLRKQYCAKRGPGRRGRPAAGALSARWVRRRAAGPRRRCCR
jgi:hypothetical protein